MDLAQPPKPKMDPMEAYAVISQIGAVDPVLVAVIGRHFADPAKTLDEALGVWPDHPALCYAVAALR